MGVLACISSAPRAHAADTPTADEKKAIDLVGRLGGKAVLDPKLPATARVSAKFEAATDGTFASLKKSPQIGAIDVFDATRCTEKGFVALKELPELRKLTLGKSHMTLPRVTAIGQCTELRSLYLAGSGLSDAELVGLKTLTFLESLDISDNLQVTDNATATLKALERLQALYLGKTAFTDKGLMELKGLDALRSLSVVGTKVTGDAAEKFADEMPNLRVVRR